jgi:hypothetical protein
MSIMKKMFYVLPLLLAFSCKKPTDDLKIVVDTDIIKYTALIHVTEAANSAISPRGATISISGADADDIYEVSGKKVFKLISGIITIGPGPAAVPTAGKPDSCIIEVKASGYNTITRHVIFNVDTLQQVINVGLVKTGATTSPIVSVPQPTPVNDTVALKFTGVCVNKASVEIRPSIYVFYRQTGSGSSYQYLGFMDKGDLSTTALVKGKTYDFQITYGGTNYMVSQKIDELSYNLTLVMACTNF